MSQGRGWCSLRLRFDGRELELLKGAEQVRGAALAHTTRPDVLRRALSLAKTGQKLRSAGTGASVSLEESELELLLDALQFATEEVRHATRADNGSTDAPRRESVFGAYPELVQKGTWRSFGLVRELEALAARLTAALRS